MRRHLKKRYIPIVVAVIEGTVVVVSSYVSGKDSMYNSGSNNVFIIEGDIKIVEGDSFSFLE